MRVDNLVYHYTTIEALAGIVSNDKITFWATRYGYLNDIFEKMWSQKHVKSIIDKDLEGADHSPEIINDLIDRHPYIISFCDIPDYRNMWRLYCNDGLGVCIGLNTEILSQIAEENRLTETASKQDYFEHVIYCTREKVPESIRFWKNTGSFNLNPNESDDNLYAMSAFIKCDEFDIENEVRYSRMRENKSVKIIPTSNKKGFTHESEENFDNVKYRLRNQKEVVPYIEIDFPSQIIEKIIVGYGYDNMEMAKHYVRQILSKNPVLANLEIESSKLNI